MHQLLTPAGGELEAELMAFDGALTPCTIWQNPTSWGLKRHTRINTENDVDGGRPHLDSLH
jgi:hypothetical protein